MVGATLYIIRTSARNRIRQRLRRLREPRYLVGALAGVGYLVFTLAVRQRAYEPSTVSEPASALPAWAPLLAGVMLGAASLAGWLMPFGSNLLVFSRPETELLYPSPLARWQLVLYRLMRSHFAVFAGALIMAVAYPTGSMTNRLTGLATAWVLLMTVHSYFTGITLAREQIRRTRSMPLFAWPALVLSITVVLSVLGPLVTTPHVPTDVTDLAALVAAIADHGVARFLLAPFIALVRPFFVHTPAEFLVAMSTAVAIYLLIVMWLLWADASCVEVADANVERLSTARPRRAQSYRYRDLGWRLAPVGRPEPVFVWKALVRSARSADRRTAIRISLILLWMIVTTTLVTRAQGLILLFGVFSTWGALFTAFMAPQVVRLDLREDLAHLEWLKAWPVRGAALIRGEIIWPAAAVTAVSWAFALAALVLSLVSTSRIPFVNRGAAWLAFLAITPGVVIAQYTIHNAIAVIFPGWVPLGATRPRGVDAAGQRLILLTASWCALAVALIPGLAVAAVLSFFMRPLLGALVLPIGAFVTTLAVIGECWVVSELLGPVFERMDLTSIERPD